MNIIEHEIKMQHGIIDKFNRIWHNDMQSKDIKEIKAWFYEIAIYMVYHFYTEEFFFDEDDVAGKFHMDAHRKILSDVFKILVLKGETEIIAAIDDVFHDYLVIHRKNFDQFIRYSTKRDRRKYFVPSGDHGGFVLVAFKKGYYTIGYGTMTKEVAGNYTLDPSQFDDKWVKFVDFTRWQYLTQDSIEAARKVNEIEINHGLRKSYFILNNDGLSTFSIKQFISDQQDNEYLTSLDALQANEDLRDLIQSEIIGINIIASTSYIDAYYTDILNNHANN